MQKGLCECVTCGEAQPRNEPIGMQLQEAGLLFLVEDRRASWQRLAEMLALGSILKATERPGAQLAMAEAAMVVRVWNLSECAKFVNELRLPQQPACA